MIQQGHRYRCEQGCSHVALGPVNERGEAQVIAITGDVQQGWYPPRWKPVKNLTPEPMRYFHGEVPR